MLLATPWQGFAAAAMLNCDAGSRAATADSMAEPTAEASPRRAVVDHRAMHHATAGFSVHDPARSHSHGVRKTAHDQCSNCAACCLALALQPSIDAVLQTEAAGSESIPFLPASPATFVPETPQRPPQDFVV
jgi:hypothetical protein